METAPEPRWNVPNPYGYPGAIESMGSVAAPFLAGTSVALAVFVMQSANAFAWASAALLFLILAAFAFVAAIQFTFWARQYAVTPPEMEMWWPDAESAGRREMLRREQRRYRKQHAWWSRLARGAYDVGIVAFLLGAMACLVPSGGLANASEGRIGVFVVAVVGLVAECAWVISNRWGSRSQGDSWPPPPGPESASS